MDRFDIITLALAFILIITVVQNPNPNSIIFIIFFLGIVFWVKRS